MIRDRQACTVVVALVAEVAEVFFFTTRFRAAFAAVVASVAVVAGCGILAIVFYAADAVSLIAKAVIFATVAHIAGSAFIAAVFDAADAMLIAMFTRAGAFFVAVCLLAAFAVVVYIALVAIIALTVFRTASL